MPVRHYAFLALVSLAVAALPGCSGASGVVADDAEEAYNKGMNAYAEGRFDRAIEYLRATLDFGRAGEWADEAQVYLARAYYQTGQYLLAAAEFDRFSDLYPSDPRTEEARFGEIQSYYRLSPPYDLDQTDTDRAILLIRTFMANYPNSVFTDDVVGMLEELREKLARKEYEAGRLYERRELYEAATLTYQSMLETYPTSPYADDALLGALRAQVAYAAASVRDRQAERFAEALALYDRFVELFPNSPLLREAEGLYDLAFAGQRQAESWETAQQASRQPGQ
ncbi:MAG: outer membrane protein assembly factor BamD [Rubricoccaceae bacterium]|nr:outer membrane protein assembly factor BamD [Rubricoccaceae bacterium]